MSSTQIQELRGNQKPRGFAKQRMKIEVAQDAVVKAYELEKQAGECLLKADELKNKAYRYMYTFDLSHLDVEQTDLTLRLQSISRTTITYDKEKLKRKLPKHILAEVIGRKYVVSDMDALKEIMKEYGVPAKMVRACFEVTEFVDKKRMDDLYEQGHIKIKQLDGCYTLKDNVTLKIKELQQK
jgi:hypothetical protein